MSLDPTRRTITAPGGAGWKDLGEALGELLQNVADGIGKSLMGILQGGVFASVDQASLYLTDGQEALEDEIELLSPLLDYGSVCMPAGQPHQGQGMLPFSRQIGPMRGVEIVHAQGGSGLRFLDKGLWEINLHVTASWVAVADGLIEIQANVYPPGGGGVYSTQSSILNPMRLEAIAVAFTSEQTHTISMTVVVPEPGYYVLARAARCAITRNFLGGPAWSRMTVQHLSREVDGPWWSGSEPSDDVEEQEE